MLILSDNLQNFLSRAYWRLYEIRKHLTCLCTTWNLLINTTIESLNLRLFKWVSWGNIWQLLLEGNTADRMDRMVVSGVSLTVVLVYQVVVV